MAEELKLDERTFEELDPADQGFALLALLAMDAMGLSLEDIIGQLPPRIRGTN